STSRSDSLLPSIRVEEPMLSMVATRRNADSRSGASVPRARQAPLNSSMPAIRPRISRDIWRESVRIMQPIIHPFTPKILGIHLRIHLHLFRQTTARDDRLRVLNR